MPIYEYFCGTCSHEFETIQKISDEPLEFCPECGKQDLAKKMSAAAFHLKGTGWYETDFKDKPKDTAKDNAGAGTATKSSDGSDSSGSGSSGSSSGDSGSGSSDTSGSGSTKSSASKDTSSSSGSSAQSPA